MVFFLVYQNTSPTNERALYKGRISWFAGSGKMYWGWGFGLRLCWRLILVPGGV